MCSARWWRLMAVCLGAGLSSVARAQTVAEYTKRVDSLTTAWRAAVAAQMHADSARALALPSDTIRVGNLVVLSDGGHVELSRATAAIVSPELDRAFGGWAARMQSHVLVVRRPTASGTPDDVTIVESGVADSGGRVLLTSSSLPTTEALAAAWRRKSEEYLSRDLDPPFREWLGVSVPIEPMTARGLAKGRVDLVLAHSRVAHECARGSAQACEQMLGLTPVDDPAFDLFDARERLDMIKWYSFVLQRRDPGSYARCVSAGAQAVCDSLVRSFPGDVIPKPAPPKVRLNFVQYALMLGGEGSFDRLVQTQGTLGDRIAAAAKMPVDSVVSRWQSNLMSSSSSSTAIDVATALSSVFWACLCGALALRSSRWR